MSAFVKPQFCSSSQGQETYELLRRAPAPTTADRLLFPVGAIMMRHMVALWRKFETAKRVSPVLIPISCTTTIDPSHGGHLEGLMMTAISYLKPLFTSPHLICLLTSLGYFEESIYKIQLGINSNLLLHIRSTLAFLCVFCSNMTQA